jgi:hypothetical protein
MQGFDEQTFFREARHLHKRIDYDKKLESLESILVFERKWQNHYDAIKGAVINVRRLYYHILMIYLFLSEELSTEEEDAFDVILENYTDIGLVHRGEPFVL